MYDLCLVIAGTGSGNRQRPRRPAGFGPPALAVACRDIRLQRTRLLTVVGHRIRACVLMSKPERSGSVPADHPWGHRRLRTASTPRSRSSASSRNEPRAGLNVDRHPDAAELRLNALGAGPTASHRPTLRTPPSSLSAFAAGRRGRTREPHCNEATRPVARASHRGSVCRSASRWPNSGVKAGVSRGAASIAETAGFS